MSRSPSDSPTAKTLRKRSPERIAANYAHAVWHVFDDYSEEDAQTGNVTVEIPAFAWKELNRVIDQLGDDPHEVLHTLIGVNDDF